jgi:hypothetical protein
VYITIAEYGTSYEEYLFGGSLPDTPRGDLASPLRGKGGSSNTPESSSSNRSSSDTDNNREGDKGKETVQPWVDNGFLTMKCYGPFDTRIENHLKHLCLSIVALTLELAPRTGYQTTDLAAKIKSMSLGNKSS